SIEKDINSRSYIEKNNNIKLEEVTIFTFEPHIAKERGHWGFKRENIYYFENGNIKVMGQQDLLTIF
ncbi:MAG: hypothetical protein CMH30_03095, partial [Micavibrio sp.]|nr:hypothetical protein [Micavibrio sp.]